MAAAGANTATRAPPCLYSARPLPAPPSDPPLAVDAAPPWGCDGERVARKVCAKSGTVTPGECALAEFLNSPPLLVTSTEL
ncbi:hypothetical protein SLA_0066 [Streptomyces laurentii]|uniref:Uncharacterized protein n=1 Tax=Streptomyces laurentii TaxID=39478 RepID=A0A160NU37_STRLU|nr:hypothetical protein SLA_0066 [Streptomyces laurentii]